MLLKNLKLQNFRSYKQASFDFDKTNIIVGKNTLGKTNILEAIFFLSLGKSFRAEKDVDTIKDNEEIARIDGELLDEDKTKLTIALLKKDNIFRKKYLINDIPKRQIDFVSKILVTLFTPSDIEIITGSPNLRRNYFDNILYQASKKYRLASSLYDKALRHRNRMLFAIKEGKKIPKKEEFEYWDNLLIENGSIITSEREDLVNFINESPKNIFDFEIVYDKSTITAERIEKYFEIEQKTGITLIGPQRDDFIFNFPNSVRKISEFGSRGEQRLTVLQTKILEIEFLKESLGKDPILLLDDIFSELDDGNSEKVQKIIGSEQVIITTAHKELVPEKLFKEAKIIDLNH